MANPNLDGVTIGSALNSLGQTALASTRGTAAQMAAASRQLGSQQALVGQQLSAGLASGSGNLNGLRQQYEQLGQRITRLDGQQQRLNRSVALGTRLREQRAGLGEQLGSSVSLGMTLARPLLMAGASAADYQAQVQGVSRRAGLNPAEQEALSNNLRSSALQWNQTQAQLLAGTKVLVAGGVSSVAQLNTYTPVLAKAATAGQGSMEALGALALDLNNNLAIGASGLERSLSRLSFIGASGGFDLPDLTQWLPTLTPQFAALGLTGEQAVAEIAGALQIARRGAGSNDEAAANVHSFVGQLSSPESMGRLQQAGIDLQGNLSALTGQGLTPVQAMLQVITEYVGSKGPAALSEFQAALSLGNAPQRTAALDQLNAKYQLGGVFAAPQALAFMQPAMADRSDFSRLQQGSAQAADNGQLQQDWAAQMQQPQQQFKSLGLNVAELGLTVGSILLPSLVELSQATIPLIQSLSSWINANPELFKGLLSVVGSLVLGRSALLGVGLAINLVLTPLVALGTAFIWLAGKWTLLKGLLQAGRLAPLVNGLRLVGQTVLWLGRALLMNPIGLLITAVVAAAYLIYRYWEPIKGFFSGLWTGIKNAFTSAWESLKTRLGTMWEGLKTGLSSVWEWLKNGVSSALDGITNLLNNFSPLGLFYQAFAGVMDYFGIELPGTFSEFGGLMIGKLVDGISAMTGAVKDTVVGLGTDIANWFKGALGLASAEVKAPPKVLAVSGVKVGAQAAPSSASAKNIAQQSSDLQGRVAQVMQQARSGVGSSTPATLRAAPVGVLAPVGQVPRPAAPAANSAAPTNTSRARRAAAGVAAVAALNLSAPNMAAAAPGATLPPPNRLAVSRVASSSAAPQAAPSIHFNPVIQLKGDAEAGAQVKQALQLSFADFERLMQRYQAGQARRGYGDIA